MSRSYLQSDMFTPVVSPLTGNTVYRNDSDDAYLLPPTFAIFKARVTCARIITGWTLEDYWSRLDGTKYGVACKDLATVKNKAEFIFAFNALFQTVNDAGKIDSKLLLRTGLKRRLVELTSALWESGQLASPLKTPFVERTNVGLDGLNLGEGMRWIHDIKDACRSPSEVMRRRAAFTVWRLAMTAAGVRAIGDVTPESTRRDAIDNYRGFGIHAVRPLIAVQKLVYGDRMTQTEHDWGWGRGRAKDREDFSAEVALDPGLVKWRDLIIEWVGDETTGNRANKSNVARSFVNYLSGCPHVTRNPIEFVSREYRNPIRYEEWLDARKFDSNTASKHIAGIANLCDWYVDFKLALEDDFGRPIRSPQLFNPITRRKEKARASETAREALPIRYVRELIQIITENDFAWAKAISEDNFKLFNRERDAWEMVWSPVRAYLLLIKLYLPLRTFQVAMLDSGEADSMVFEGGAWVANNTSIAPMRSSRHQGFLREFKDANTGSSITGFYVNTNKTADRFKNLTDKGYQIPWQHNEVIELVEKLINWQKNFNPISRPTKWVELTNPNIKRGYTDAQLVARGETCFLFRDPVRARKDHPIYTGRITSFWHKLLDELEKRVEKRGERLPNGEVIRFIQKRSAEGSPLVPVFDLHSLRVSILTALSVEGGVPLSILSKCVAGHANVLMTLYYLKPGPAYVSQQMAEAQARMMAREQENYIRFLQNSDLEQAQSVVAFNDQAGIFAAKTGSAAGWVVGDLGICPVGGARCDVGGPRISADKTRNDYQPTPGGPRNCVRCRFFLTGPAFLGGLVANFNSVGLEVLEASESLQKMQSDINSLEDNLFNGETADPDLFRKVDVLYSRRETAMKRLDEVANNWHATFILIERAKALLSDQKSGCESGAVRLLSGGGVDDIATVMEQTTKFDLYNNICQHATIYPAPTVPKAVLRRGRLLDSMLAKNHRFPVFATLTEAEALSVGNELVNFLYARLGRNEVTSVIEGSRLLQAVGLGEDLDALLSNQVEAPIRLATLIEQAPLMAALTLSNPLGTSNEN